MPRLKWRGGESVQPPGGAATAYRAFPHNEGCALNGQVTAFENSDQMVGEICHDHATLCAPGSYVSGSTFCPGGTECPPGAGGGPTGDGYQTYLAYRWLDLDADGLVDLVAAVHGDIDRYDVERGSKIGYFENGEPAMPGIPGLGQWPACPNEAVAPEQCKDLGDCLARQSAQTCTGGVCTTNWSAVNACLASAPNVPCFSLIAKPGPGVDGTSNETTPFSRAPYSRCEGGEC